MAKVSCDDEDVSSKGSKVFGQLHGHDPISRLVCRQVGPADVLVINKSSLGIRIDGVP